MNRQQARKRIAQAFSRYLAITKKSAFALVPPGIAWGKLYEARVLAEVCKQLHNQENADLQLSGSNALALKFGGGPINVSFGAIDVLKGGTLVGTLRTDIYVAGISTRLGQHPISPPHFHEVDIVMTTPGSQGVPVADDVILAVECKNTPYEKRLFRELLGLRRELSFLKAPQPTLFSTWPRTAVPSDPPSVLLSYSTSRRILHYQAPAESFGIGLMHLGF